MRLNFLLSAGGPLRHLLVSVYLNMIGHLSAGKSARHAADFALAHTSLSMLCQVSWEKIAALGEHAQCAVRVGCRSVPARGEVPFQDQRGGATVHQSALARGERATAQAERLGGLLAGAVLVPEVHREPQLTTECADEAARAPRLRTFAPVGVARQPHEQVGDA